MLIDILTFAYEMTNNTMKHLEKLYGFYQQKLKENIIKFDEKIIYKDVPHALVLASLGNKN